MLPPESMPLLQLSHTNRFYRRQSPPVVAESCDLQAAHRACPVAGGPARESEPSIRESIVKLSTLLTALFALFLLVAGTAQAQTMYIDDTMYAPVRSGEGTQFRIVHRGLRSGTSVEVLERNEETGYSRIRYGDDNEGYIPTRYLTSTPIAAHRLAQANAELERLRQSMTGGQAELEEAKSELRALRQREDELEEELASVTAELERITEISEDSLEIDRRNTELRETNQDLQKEVELLTTENQRLKDRRDSDFLLMGGGLVVLGIFIALIFPLLKPTRKSDTWA